LDERYHSLIPANIKGIQVGAEFVGNSGVSPPGMNRGKAVNSS